MTAEPDPPPAPRDAPDWAAPPGPARAGSEIGPGDGPPRDLALYPRLISDGIAAADRRGGAIDHVTARRMSLMLLSQTADRKLSQGLARFVGDGAVTRELRQSLRHYARQPGHPHHPHSWRLLQYAAARGTNLGPVGADFAAACDQADRADAARTASPPDRKPGADEKASEGTQPSYPPRRDRPVYAYVLWASDWAKEQNPANRANLYDALRAGTDPAPTIPYAPAGSTARKYSHPKTGPRSRPRTSTTSGNHGTFTTGSATTRSNNTAGAISREHAHMSRPDQRRSRLRPGHRYPSVNGRWNSLADAISRQYVDTGHSAWGHVEGWAAEPAMTAPEALARPLRATAGHSAAPHPEAAN